MGGLNPNDGKPRFLQLYFYDLDNELQSQHQWGAHLDLDVTRVLQDILHQCNPFIVQFKRLSLENDLTTRSICLNDRAINVDQRRYNKPSADQVAGIWIGGKQSCCDVSFIDHC